jgi:hypothetical protein
MKGKTYYIFSIIMSIFTTGILSCYMYEETKSRYLIFFWGIVFYVILQDFFRRSYYYELDLIEKKELMKE